MQSSTKRVALVPVVKRIGQRLVLMSLLALLALMGADLSHAHQASAPTGVWMAAPAGEMALYPTPGTGGGGDSSSTG